MGEHRNNVFSQAKAAGNQIVRAMDLGEGLALLGVQLMPVLDEAKENLVILLAAVGGRPSQLIPIEPRPVIVAELAKVPLASLRKALTGGGPTDAGGEPLVEGTPEPAEDNPPLASSEPEEKPHGLVLVP